MGKSLSEMTLEELWNLFPIVLTEHKGYWAEWYLEEEKRILKLLSKVDRIKINNIGKAYY